METQPIHTPWSQIPIEPMNPLLGRQFVTGVHLTAARITLTKGVHVPTHTHPSEQLAILLTGCLKFILYPENQAPREILLHPGELLIIPPNIPHEAFALEDSIDLDIFSPPRQDWIDGSDAYLRTPAKT